MARVDERETNVGNEIKTDKPTERINPDLQLVDGPTLLEVIFPERCRPTHRWLQHQVKRRNIPSIKCGHLRFYVPAAVRTALQEKTVHARGRRGR